MLTSAKAPFSIISRARTTSSWPSEKCTQQAGSRYRDARRTDEPMPDFLRSLGVRMTQEPTRNPAIIRALLQAYLFNDSGSCGHDGPAKTRPCPPQPDDSSSVRTAAKSARTFRLRRSPTFFAKPFSAASDLVLYGDATLHSRSKPRSPALSGLAPRGTRCAGQPHLFTSGD